MGSRACTVIPTPRASSTAAPTGWEFEGSGGEPEYFVARLRGLDVAGLAPMPEGCPPTSTEAG